MFWRAQVRIQSVGLLPEDDVVNVWHFDSDLNDATVDEDLGAAEITADFESIRTGLQDFYVGVSTLLANDALVDNATIKAYRLSDPSPRVPLREGIITANWSATSPMPREVALCVSFQAEKVSGQPQARRRGRIFLGPLGYNTGTLVSGEHRPSTATRTAIQTAATNLLLHPGPGEPKWAVYSRTEDITNTLANAFNDVTDGWVDDAYDTQRRRGKRPLAKFTF